MDSQHSSPSGLGGSPIDNATLRQQREDLRRQREELRRRLIRLDRDRASRGSRGGSTEATPSRGTNTANTTNTAELLAITYNDRQGIQWTFQTPQAAHDEAQGDGEGGDDGGYEDDRDVGVGGEVDEVEDDKGSEDEQEDEAGCNDDEPQFDPSAMGLKEISNLASFTVSSYKPGCGVKELRDDDANQFWQSDGPQPHRLNIHFIKRVEIRALRLYLDYELDESYTPTKIQITAGFGPNQTIPFTTMDLSMPKGWIDVPIAGAGGGADGNSLCCWFVRVIVVENHQNGKDTHIRGVKVYALDDTADTAENNPVDDMVEAIDDYSERMAEMDVHDHDEDTLKKIEEDKQRRKAKAKKYTPGDGGLSIPDFMREPEIR